LESGIKDNINNINMKKNIQSTSSKTIQKSNKRESIRAEDIYEESDS
jgi:hypothetical protein